LNTLRLFSYPKIVCWANASGS